MIPIVEIIFHYSMLPLVKINVHQVGMIPLVNRECHHWILSLVGKNVHQGLLLVQSGDKGKIYPIKHICLSLVERGGWEVLPVWLPYQSD